MDFLFKINQSELLVLVRKDCVLLLQERNLLERNGGHFVMVQCFWNDYSQLVNYSII